MKYFKFHLLCYEGKCGWGKTGATAEMCVRADTEREAIEYVETHIPLGWKPRCLGETDDTFYLRHTS